MQLVQRILARWRPRPARRRGLALAGGGVIGGMYEVGALAALEESLNGGDAFFDVYVGCSAGSVVASLMANGVQPGELYRILEQDLPDPFNFRRGAVYASDSARRAFGTFGRLLWALGRNAFDSGGSLPDMLARAEGKLPAGFFKLSTLERFLREALAARGLTNSFSDLKRTLLIPAVDLDRAERVVFGRGELGDVPISQAVAASSAIPGFFEPHHIDGRDYVDGGVGFSGHADLAAESGAEIVLVVNPLVPNQGANGAGLRSRGLYSIMEQANRIYSQNLLKLGLDVMAARHPRTAFFLLQPPHTATEMFGPSMGFEASRAALRYGYASTREWLQGEGAPLVRLLTPPDVPTLPARDPAPNGAVRPVTPG
jgi:NTE family protein